MSILVTDRVTFKASKRSYTDEGFLLATGRAARTGIQQYLASEIGVTDRSPTDIVNVYRPADEVFDADSLASYDVKDVTDDHPSDLVDSKNHKKLTVGFVRGAGVKDGDFVSVELVIKDQSIIDKINSGKSELSAGYLAEYEKVSGVTEDGTEYEYIQKDIRINHVAVVDRARAGNLARILDEKKGGFMPNVTLDSGKSVAVQDEATATLVQDALDRLKKSADDAATRATDAETEKEKMQAEKDKADEELEEEKKKSSDASISGKIKAIDTAKESARKVAGSEFSCDSLDVTEIKRAALSKVRDSVDFGDKSAAYVDAAFDMAVEDAGKEQGKEQGKAESLKGLAKDMASGKDMPVNHRQKSIDSMSGAWKKNVGDDA